MFTRSCSVLCAAATMVVWTAAADPLPTAFTYQGSLTASGALVNTPTDVQCSLWDAASGGTQVGSTLTQTAVTVENGLFVVSLDFGVDPYASAKALWLQIAVRNPTGTGSYTVLGTRQALTAAPYSLATRGITVDSAGKVNIGSSGVGRLNVAGPLQIDIGQFPDPPRPSLFFAGSSGGTSVGIGTYSFNATGMNSYGLDFYTSYVRQMSLTQAGNLGIGTVDPKQKLHVIGNVQANNVTVPSSIRFKDTVTPMGDALSGLLKLRGVRFDWKPEYAAQRGFTHDIGFVAEEVEKVFPEVVFHDGDGTVSGMDYSRLTAVTVEAIKQQESVLQEQAARLARQAEENRELRARLERLEAALSASATPAK